MPLGDQFKNTFYTDENGETRFYTRNKSAVPEEYADNQRGMTRHIGDAPDPEWHAPSYQGMLFNPHWGTGSRMDPSISDEERTTAIHKALNMDDIEKFRRVGQPVHTHEYFHKETGETVDHETLDSNDRWNVRHHPDQTVYGMRPVVQPRMSAKRAVEQRDAVTRAALRSGIRHQMWEGIDTNVEVKPMNSGAIGHFDPSQNIIRLKEAKKTESVPIAEPKALPPTKRGAPIANPNWREQTAALGDVYEGYTHRDIFKTGINHEMRYRPQYSKDTAPATMPRTAEEAVPPTYFDEHGTPTSTPDDHHYLPEGHSANIFPGKGQSTSSYIATPMKVTRQNQVTNRNQTLWYHLRHEAVPDESAASETPEEPKPQRFRKITTAINVNTNTLAHELGHVRHAGIRDAGGWVFNPDPIFEGVADGQKDRHGMEARRGKFYEEDLLPGERRNQDINNSGYSPSSFDTPLHKAAYVASRVHASTNDTAGGDLLRRPRSRVDNPNDNYSDDAIQLSLGQMYHKHQHVRDALKQAGPEFEYQGQAAHKIWASHQTDAAKTPHSTLFDL
jgi:hypothetical protein